MQYVIAMPHELVLCIIIIIIIIVLAMCVL
jgi:hypothetical protein